MGHTMPRSSIRSSPLSVAAALPLMLAAGWACAEGDPQRVATAMVLYDQALAAMDAKDYETACPKLEAALRLEPSAIGGRLTLGECYEAAGRLASAWAAFVSAEQAAKQANQPERQEKARKRVEALRLLLATVRIVVADEAKTLRRLKVLRDRVEVGAEQWDVPIPIDRGSHVIVVTATGKKKIEKTFEVDHDGQEVRVTVPRLRDAEPPAELPAEPPPVPKPEVSRETSLGNGTYLHIESHDRDSQLILYSVDGMFSGAGSSFGYGPNGPTVGTAAVGGLLSHAVCAEPCDREIEGAFGQEFYLGGDGITPSSSFRLLGQGRRATLRVSPGSRGTWFTGVFLTSFGVASTLLVGMPFLAADAVSQSNSHTPVGGAFLGVGLGLLLVGIPVLLAGRTTYSFVPQELSLRF
jgi:hypothetical protein